MYRYYLALRYLLSRPINLIGMAGVVVSVWALIVVVSIFSGFLEEVRAHIRAATSDISIIPRSGPASFADLEPLIRADPNVADCAPRIVWFGLLHALNKRAEVLPSVKALSGPGADSPFISLIGVDPGAEARVTGFAQWLRKADGSMRVADLEQPLLSVDGRPAILLSQRRLENEFTSPGGVVEVTSARLTGGGITPEQLTFLDQEFVIAGAYATKHHAFDNTNCFVHIDHLRSMMQTEQADPITEIVVRCVDPSQNEETARRLEEALSNDPEQLRHRIAVRTWQHLNEPILSAVDHQRSLMKLVLFVIMVVAAFLMFATLSMMVTEKTHDIGILTAMGATRRGVMQVFMSCGLSIVLIGAALGTVIGCLSAYYLDDFNSWLRAHFDVDLFPTRVYNLERVPYDLDPLWITQVAAMALLVGLLVSGIPAWRAARHDPLQSLRNE